MSEMSGLTTPARAGVKKAKSRISASAGAGACRSNMDIEPPDEADSPHGLTVPAEADEWGRAGRAVAFGSYAGGGPRVLAERGVRATGACARTSGRRSEVSVGVASEGSGSAPAA